jgi:hypothetical protein
MINALTGHVPDSRSPSPNYVRGLSIAPGAKEPTNPIGYQVPQAGIVDARAVARTAPTSAVAYAARKPSHALSGALALRTLST